MQWINIDKDKLGTYLYVTPNYADGNNRSCIDYCSGIPEIDNALAEKGKPFSAMNVELGILVYEEILMFILVRGSKAVGHFSIGRDKVVQVKATHDQLINIRKDPGMAVGAVISRVYGILWSYCCNNGRHNKRKERK